MNERQYKWISIPGVLLGKIIKNALWRRHPAGHALLVSACLSIESPGPVYRPRNTLKGRLACADTVSWIHFAYFDGRCVIGWDVFHSFFSALFGSQKACSVDYVCSALLIISVFRPCPCTCFAGSPRVPGAVINPLT